MKRNWMAMLVMVGGAASAVFGQQYPQQYPPQYQQHNPQQYPTYQNDENYNRQYGNNQYDNGQYADDQGYGAYDGYPGDNGGGQGDYAPAPPPMPNYAYQRPPMPGPGYFWVDGYWNFLGGRYSWVGGSWMLPPYSGGYWTAPRYVGGRFFRGYWGGGGRDFNRGFVRNNFRNEVRGRSEFRSGGGDYRGARAGNRGHHEGRR